MLFAVVGSSSISSTRMLNPPFAARRVSLPLNSLEAFINHSRDEGKRLIFCNGLESLRLVARVHQGRPETMSVRFEPFGWLLAAAAQDKLRREAFARIRVSTSLDTNGDC